MSRITLHRYRIALAVCIWIALLALSLLSLPSQIDIGPKQIIALSMIGVSGIIGGIYLGSWIEKQFIKHDWAGKEAWLIFFCMFTLVLFTGLLLVVIPPIAIMLGPSIVIGLATIYMVDFNDESDEDAPNQVFAPTLHLVARPPTTEE